MSRFLTRRTLLLAGIIVVGLGVAYLFGMVGSAVRDPFSTDTANLTEAGSSEVIALRDGATLELRATIVRKRIGNATVKMLGFNGTIPGPTLRVTQGSEVTIKLTNATDVETTVHWHGVRVDNRFDGVPQKTQQPIPVGGVFTYHVRFPDAGVFWYHPHIREDYAQELGLYGNILVVPAEAAYWPAVNREVPVVLDDILIERGRTAPFSRTEPIRTAMGRFGNVMLTSGATDFSLRTRRGEVVRFYFTNTANTRLFNVRIPGSKMKLVGGDIGRIERETFVDDVLIAPAERAVVDVLFDRPGQLAFEHKTPERTYRLGTITVEDVPAEPILADEFATLRTNADLVVARTASVADLARAPDKTIALVGNMAGMGHHGGDDQHEGLEWEDTMVRMNRTSSPRNMFWKIIDRQTGAENDQIQWSFRVGDRVKIRIVNEAKSDHPMQHPFHIHGQRFLVLSRNGKANDNLVWKDTVLVRSGETVDVLLEVTNPGVWMAHCHIAEHIESGMMFSYRVSGTGRL